MWQKENKNKNRFIVCDCSWKEWIWKMHSWQVIPKLLMNYERMIHYISWRYTDICRLLLSYEQKQKQCLFYRQQPVLDGLTEFTECISTGDGCFLSTFSVETVFIRSLIFSAICKKVFSTLVAFFADVSRNSIPNWSAYSCDIWSPVLELFSMIFSYFSNTVLDCSFRC